MHYLYATREDFTNLYIIISIFIYASILVYVFILIPAAFNVSLGFLNIYVKFLLFFFDWGRRKVSRNHKLQQQSVVDNDSESDEIVLEETESVSSNGAKIVHSDSAEWANSANEYGEEISANEKQDKRGTVDDLSETSHVEDVAALSAATQESENSNLNSDYARIIDKKGSVGLAEYARKLYEPCYERLLTDQRFDLSDISFYIKAGVDSIVQDDVTQRFQAEELKSWNFLTRTNHIYKHDMGFRLSLIWFFGFLFRYLIMFPVRAIIFVIGIGTYANCTLIVSFIPQSKLKDALSKRLSLMSYRVLCRGFSAIVRFHDRDNLPTGGGVCVANHTSPIDALILSCDNCYVLIGQRHGGFTGFMQNAMSRLASHVWFERSQKSDREGVIKKVAEHASDPTRTPILIFPEGTCINNTSVMMFRKGSFEYSDLVYPVAIKYDARFGDAFWNSSKHSMLRYVLYMMTSWAIVCDVWYLPAARRLPGEDVVSFAYRVKRLIATRGGLVDLEWDGNLKRSKVNPLHLDKLKQRTFAQAHTRTSCNNLLGLDIPSSKEEKKLTQVGQNNNNEIVEKGDEAAMNIADSNKLKLL